MNELKSKHEILRHKREHSGSIQTTQTTHCIFILHAERTNRWSTCSCTWKPNHRSPCPAKKKNTAHAHQGITLQAGHQAHLAHHQMENMFMWHIRKATIKALSQHTQNTLSIIQYGITSRLCVLHTNCSQSDYAAGRVKWSLCSPMLPSSGQLSFTETVKQDVMTAIGGVLILLMGVYKSLLSAKGQKCKASTSPGAQVLAACGKRSPKFCRLA